MDASRGFAVSTAPAAAAAASGNSYFTDQKKGEVNELKQLLRNVTVERDPKKRRDVIKKVIAYMTLGVDVSRLFTEMLMAIETRDLVIKKMVYLYMCTYAQSNPDLAIMCVNTLQRDCGNEDPMVRGLALRSLCSLRLPSIVEYISCTTSVPRTLSYVLKLLFMLQHLLHNSEPLRRSLVDGNAYVRKTGVMAVLKMYHLSPDLVRDMGLVDTLYAMLQDVDTQCVLCKQQTAKHISQQSLVSCDAHNQQVAALLKSVSTSDTCAARASTRAITMHYATVVTNCLLVLNEMSSADQGGMSLNRGIVLQLLRRIDSFNEWGLCQVLSIVSRYTPADEDEGFSIMNLLDPVLRTSNSGVVLAVVKCFLHITESMPDIQAQPHCYKVPLGFATAVIIPHSSIDISL
eukprot:19094-Heterococcus_DN1.PRE.3